MFPLSWNDKTPQCQRGINICSYYTAVTLSVVLLDLVCPTPVGTVASSGRPSQCQGQKEQRRGDGSARGRHIRVKGIARQKSHRVSASALSVLKVSFEGW